MSFIEHIQIPLVDFPAPILTAGFPMACRGTKNQFANKPRGLWPIQDNRRNCLKKTQIFGGETFLPAFSPQKFFLTLQQIALQMSSTLTLMRLFTLIMIVVLDFLKCHSLLAN